MALCRMENWSFLAPHEKFVYRGKKITVPMGHGFPLREEPAVLEEIARQMQRAVDAAGTGSVSGECGCLCEGSEGLDH